MIGHVFDNVKNNLLTDYAVATCDTEIYEYICLSMVKPS